MPDQVQTLLHQWFEEVWNKGRAEAIDEMLASDATAHGLVDSSGNEVQGPEAFKSFQQSFRNAFPDIQVTVEDTVTEGDKITARCTVKGTHTGEGVGLAPTGRGVEFEGICIGRVKDGKIVEAWNTFDFQTMYQQLSPTQPAAPGTEKSADATTSADTPRITTPQVKPDPDGGTIVILAKKDLPLKVEVIDQ
ncbi:MAG TPA: ester cyclase [Blastocatellia bacterium]|nr:ester cyclase [Blastocatellia bacterium]